MDNMVKEVVYDRKKVLAGVKKLRDAVVATMGPDGSTMVILDHAGAPFATKDGVSVANAVELDDPVEHAACGLLRQAANQTVKEAGDGTTTSICLASNILEEIYARNMGPKEAVEALFELERKGIDALKTRVKTDFKVYDVAYVASNNDAYMAESIAAAYKESTNVQVQEAIEDGLEVVKGTNLNTPFYDPAFINVREKQSIEYNSKMPLILIDGKLESLDSIGSLIANTTGFVMVVDHISDRALSILKQNYNSNNVDIAIIKAPSYATQRKSIMADLSYVFNTPLIDPTKRQPRGLELGHIDKVFSDREKTILYSEDAKERIDEKVKELTAAIDNERKEGTVLDNLQKRLQYLQNDIAVLYVGGKSDAERKERKDRYDDAVLATKCAIEEGVVPGGGMALYNLKINNPLARALKAPALQIFDGDVPKNVSKNIIDPYRVVKSALTNAISVCKVLATTKGVVIPMHLWKKV